MADGGHLEFRKNVYSSAADKDICTKIGAMITFAVSIAWGGKGNGGEGRGEDGRGGGRGGTGPPNFKTVVAPLRNKAWTKIKSSVNAYYRTQCHWRILLAKPLHVVRELAIGCPVVSCGVLWFSDIPLFRHYAQQM